MEILVRRAAKATLFTVLLFLSVRYVHTYPWPMPDHHVRVLLAISDRLGVHDPDDIYIPAMMVLELIAAIVAYVLVIRCWRLVCATRR